MEFASLLIKKAKAGKIIMFRKIIFSEFCTFSVFWIFLFERKCLLQRSRSAAIQSIMEACKNHHCFSADWLTSGEASSSSWARYCVTVSGNNKNSSRWTKHYIMCFNRINFLYIHTFTFILLHYIHTSRILPFKNQNRVSSDTRLERWENLLTTN